MGRFLAIIIPAYKRIYLQATLTSLAKQKDKDFAIYIGDDGSEDNLYEIIEPFIPHLDITYIRFEKNVGKYLLPEHWNRCLELIKEEEWIWLFSDDDVADPTCVSRFKSFAAKHPECLVFKFNSIKLRGEQIVMENTFPAIIDTVNFLKLKLGYACESYAIEYIFHRSIWQTNKFPLFPLGWCSDDLFWLKSSLMSDIYTIPGARVYWRYSNYNISGRKNDRQSSWNKLKAGLQFLNSLYNLFYKYLTWEIFKLSLSWFDSQYHYLSKNLILIDKIKIRILHRIIWLKGMSYTLFGLSEQTFRKPFRFRDDKPAGSCGKRNN